MGRGRPKTELTVTEAERETLERWARRPTTAHGLAMRARIVLRCAQGENNSEVAAKLAVSRPMIGKWRARFIERRLDGLWDEPRPGAPRKIRDAQVEAIISKAFESPPPGATHWSTRSMAKAVGLNQTAVSRVWRAFALQPHRETFKLSKDRLFVEKVRDIVGLYMAPPERALVLCVDEKSQIQASDGSQSLLAIRPGQLERSTHAGTTSLFAALDVATARVIGRCFRRHRAREFRTFLHTVEQRVAAGLDIHLILDNYSTHKTPLIQRWLLKRPRFHLHFTPTGASWINLVERWFATLTEKQLRRDSDPSSGELETCIQEYLAVCNEAPKPFIWVKNCR